MLTDSDKRAIKRLARALGYEMEDTERGARVGGATTLVTKTEHGRYLAVDPDRDLRGLERQHLSDAVLDVHFVIRVDARCSPNSSSERHADAQSPSEDS